MLGVEHDFHLDSEILVLAGCIPQENCTPLQRGGLVPLVGSRGVDPLAGGSGGQRSPGGGFGGSALEAKNRCKISL